MKKNFVLRRFVLGLALLVAATSSSSLTLGRVRGAVIVGQPLNLSIQMALDGADDPRSLCVAAEVFNGDARLDSGRVTVSVEPADAAGNAVVRLRTSSVVDEAFVSINLSAGCTQTLSRRYVLLADVITDTVAEPVAEVAPAVPAATAVPVPSPPVAAVPGPVPSARAPDVPAAQRRAADAAPRRPRTTPAAAPARSESAGTVKPAPPRPARTVVQPKLRLDPVEPMAAIDPNLRKSTELASSPAASPEKSAEAAALWRTLNAQPQDILKEAQRLQGLEAEFKAFRELTNKNQQELAARLEQAERQQNLSVYFYVVSALLALALVLAAVLWWHLRRRVEAQREWWEDREQVAMADRRLKAASGLGAGDGAGKDAANVDLDLGPGNSPVAMSHAAFDSAATMKLPAQPTPSATVVAPSSKTDHPEELFDVQQQADFFMSLGQTDQAIALLNNHIRSNEETGPLAYLDLLRIYHSTGRTQEYNALRESFMRVFNANVPEFGAYGGETRDLESYRGLVPSIQATWGTPKAEKMLEEMVYRRPGSKWDHSFELAAYGELLMLQSIAKEYSATPSGNRNAVSAFSVLPTGPRADGSAAAAGKSTGSLGLDLDLGGPEPAVGNISAYLQRPDPEFSSDAPTRPAGLGGAHSLEAGEATPALPGNLLDFDMSVPPDDPDKVDRSKA
jgi:pilus assembly protein FimV